MRLFPPPLFVGFPEGYQVLYAPQPICNASGHCRGRAKCTMNLDEIVGEIVESCGSRALFMGSIALIPYCPTPLSGQAEINTRPLLHGGLSTGPRTCGSILGNFRIRTLFLGIELLKC
jgi:hypothetical protein